MNIGEPRRTIFIEPIEEPTAPDPSEPPAGEDQSASGEMTAS